MGDQSKNERFEALFKAAGVPVKEVNAFGSRLIVTCWSDSAARKIAGLLTKGTFTVDGMKESVDYNEKNRGTCLRPTTHKVWRVWAHA